METLYSPAPPAPSRGWVGSLLLLPVCVLLCASGEPIRFFATVSGLLYDGGQALFGLAFERGRVFGGLALQIGLPLAFFAFFARYRFCFGMQVFLVWLGQNLLYVGRYGAGSAEWAAVVESLGLQAGGAALSVAGLLAGIAVFLTALALPMLMEE